MSDYTWDLVRHEQILVGQCPTTICSPVFGSNLKRLLNGKPREMYYLLTLPSKQNIQMFHALKISDKLAKSLVSHVKQT